MRFLVVDDSPDDVELLRIEFEKEGYKPVSHRVDTAGDLRDALHTAEWDRVISNDSMPRLNSLQALDEVKKSGRDMPFNLYSGTTNHRAAAMAMRAGVHDCVGKGDIARLIPSFERELKNAAVRKAMKRADSHVHRLAYYDQLTGLPNRNYFCERVGEQFSAQPNMKAAVVFVDMTASCGSTTVSVTLSAMY